MTPPLPLTLALAVLRRRIQETEHVYIRTSCAVTVTQCALTLAQLYRDQCALESDLATRNTTNGRANP